MRAFHHTLRGWSPLPQETIWPSSKDIFDYPFCTWSPLFLRLLAVQLGCFLKWLELFLLVISIPPIHSGIEPKEVTRCVKALVREWGGGIPFYDKDLVFSVFGVYWWFFSPSNRPHSLSEGKQSAPLSGVGELGFRNIRRRAAVVVSGFLTEVCFLSGFFLRRVADSAATLFSIQPIHSIKLLPKSSRSEESRMLTCTNKGSAHLGSLSSAADEAQKIFLTMGSLALVPVHKKERKRVW